MSRVVLKWPMPPDRALVVEGCNLHVVLIGVDPHGSQTTPCVWIEQAATEAVNDRLVLTFHGTGHRIPDEASDHYGSVVCGPFVWHVYGKRECV